MNVMWYLDHSILQDNVQKYMCTENVSNFQSTLYSIIKMYNCVILVYLKTDEN